MTALLVAGLPLVAALALLGMALLAVRHERWMDRNERWARRHAFGDDFELTAADVLRAPVFKPERAA